ncbi:MAG TPA: hypothetical protein VHG10_06520 [Glycomyces sp.]|nr:hypothetical protein [Glycomyces sp.]
MSGQAFPYFDGSIEFELRCDGCGTPFRCRDDSFYSWPVLCAAAESEGWRIQPGMDGEHDCGECAPAERTVRERQRPGLMTV